MNRYLLRTLIIVLTLFFVVNGIGSEKEIVLDSAFFREFSSKSAFSREDYLQTCINQIVIGRGSIRTVLERSEYKKKYVIVIESGESGRYGQKFIYHVYLEKRDTIELLSEDASFEFKGQFMGFTPLNSKRDKYIIDVVLMDG